MDCLDQRLPEVVQYGDQLAQQIRRTGVEAEVDVENVEVVGVGAYPVGGQHCRRPPGGGRVGQAAYRIPAIALCGSGTRMPQVPDVDVGGRDRGDA